ncbi:MAG: chemotaxis protein CheA [Oligoflexia bacterium]|nr:chemotaxis protein CheA [Oligoflexia bacterium]
MTTDSTSKIEAAYREKINEISLLLIMTAADDDVGITMLCEMLDALSTSPQNEATKRINTAWSSLRGAKSTLDAAQFFSQLQDLVAKAVQLCEGSGAIKFANENGGASSGAKADPLAGVDAGFLPEFIENHRMQLEDFESWLLDCEFKSSDDEDVDSLVKRYVHSLKGDAGSIGLHGIQEACHFVEDVLAQASVGELAPPLMLFREWVLSYFDALTRKAFPNEDAQQFVRRFKKACVLLLPALGTSAREAKTSSTPPKAAGSAATETDESYALTGEPDIFQEFVAEAEEHLGNVESVVLEAEGSYTSDSIDTIFRGIHSLKGGSAYFSFKEMTQSSHLLENLLDEVRTGKRELNADLTGLILSYIDLQKTLLASAKRALKADGKINRSQATVVFLDALNKFVSGKPSAAATTSTETKLQDPPVREDKEEKETATAKNEKLEVKNFVKVDTVRLDHLIDSIGEMVIYSSMLIRHCRELLPLHEEVQSITHRVEKFTRDLQDVGMSMRLVPIKGLFQKMSRLVWDTSKKIKKEINFSMDGEDTELDRNLIDKLADPLMHMVRNALDHGVEPPEEREKAGKPRVGKVHLSAVHSGGCVLIRVSDDGRGLNQEKLLAKARERGIITEGQKLSEQEIYQLIFAPGFSTAAVVTDISGRGVGMDVVRKNVESLRGRIHIESEVGSGTTFTIELPLTLAIIDGVEVLVGQEHLILPSLAIIEFVKPTPDMLNSALEQGETFCFRGKYLPIFRLADLFGIEPQYHTPEEATLIVVENHEELVALMVDDIVGELSTVIKSLGALFSESKGVSGCAVMPNGDVALILDVRALVSLARAAYHRRGTPSEQPAVMIQ